MGDARFGGATFTRNARFAGATFSSKARFENVTFTSNSWFQGATFLGAAGFQGATFMRAAKFSGATFHGTTGFSRATFTGDSSFGGATFERARQLGPMLVRQTLVLDGALFRERIQIEVSAVTRSCRRARFLAGVQLRVRWAQVVLDAADLAAPSVLAGTSSFPDLNEDDWWRVRETAWPVDPYGTPRLLSVRGADVAGLTVGAVNLQACRFVDAHNLDQLRAEGSNFPNTPQGWRWTKRRTIAEEHQWRASEDHTAGMGRRTSPRTGLSSRS
jgi:uncharacterized protein YjbI with pentapeptide repeats